MPEVTDKYIKICTTKEAARLLDVTTRTIQLWSESGIVKAWKTAGGHRRFNVADLEEFKTQLTREADDINDNRLLRVLVIEDEPDLIILYKMAIQGWDLPLVLQTAKDGFTGLIQIGAWKPDIIITDIQMPNIDGIQMLNTITKMESFNDMVIMVVTALSKYEVAKKGVLPKGIPIFPKPIPFDEIKFLIMQACEEKLNRKML